MPEKETIERAQEDAREANRRARRQVSSCGKRYTMFAKENMVRALPSKPLRSASPKRDVPA